MQRLLPDLSSLSLPSFAASFSSPLSKSSACVFSLQLRNDGNFAPRINARWEVLPLGGAHDNDFSNELALLASHALRQAKLGAELTFQEFEGTVSALLPDSANIAGLKLHDFATSDPGLNPTLQGRWTAAAVTTRHCDPTVCTLGYIATFKRDIAKL